MNKITIEDNAYLVHEAGIVTDENMIPVEVYWTDDNLEYFLAGGKKIYTHKIVAASYLGGLKGDIVRHIDGDTTNNTVSNLQMITKQQLGERVAKDHLVQSVETGEVKLVNNWSQFEEKDTHRILRTYNKDRSVSYSASPEKTTTCSHLACNATKAQNRGQCQRHVSKLAMVKKNWKNLYSEIAFDNSVTDRDRILELLDLTTAQSATYGVNLFLQLSSLFSIYDVPLTSTITDLSGHANRSFSDDFGEDFDNNEYFGLGNT